MLSKRGFKIIKPIIIGLCKVFFFMEIQGKENIPQNGGYIICSNHRSNFDPIFIAAGLSSMPNFMAKDELFHVPILGSIVRFFKAFPVKRGKSDVSAVTVAIDFIKKGELLLMFPEGTRSKTGELLKPKSGVALIASHAKCQVLPCAICTQGKVRVFKKVTLKFGIPMPLTELQVQANSASELRRSSKNIMSRIEQLINAH